MELTVSQQKVTHKQAAYLSAFSEFKGKYEKTIEIDPEIG